MSRHVPRDALLPDAVALILESTALRKPAGLWRSTPHPLMIQARSSRRTLHGRGGQRRRMWHNCTTPYKLACLSA